MTVRAQARVLLPAEEAVGRARSAGSGEVVAGSGATSPPSGRAVLARFRTGDSEPPVPLRHQRHIRRP
ncbi:hypothetical protein ACIQJT_33550 [Streptomyces sp. NPDC091972]|uniref:hypothetical protein n=1 Tax=Streptomyces sp. NPDC091972 TaxID=3366007 RepID=UPI0037F3A944